MVVAKVGNALCRVVARANDEEAALLASYSSTFSGTSSTTSAQINFGTPTDWQLHGSAPATEQKSAA